jgi:TolB-like protein
MSSNPPRGPGFLAELRDRKVLRIAVAYAAVGFVLVQVASNFFPALQLPEWTTTLVAVLVVLGFPLALVLAWALELTPDGVKRAAPLVEHGAGAGPTRRRASRNVAALGGVVALSLAGGAYFVFGGGSPTDTPPPAADAEDRSIAVLPFANLSADADNEYLSDGISEDIRGRLSRMGELRVTSRTSAVSYRGTVKHAGLIAQELGVAHLLEGTVQRAGDRLRVGVQLVHAPSDETRWSETYDRDITDVFAIQTEIAERIAEALRVRLGGGGLAGPGRGETTNLAAYELYLKGVQLLRARADGRAELRANIFGAIAFLRQSIELDPGYALPFAALAWAYGDHPDLTPRERRDSTRAFAERVVRMAPQLPDGYAELGFYHLSLARWDEAHDQFRLALDRDRNHEFALGGMRQVKEIDFRLVEALTYAHRLVEVNPAVPGPSAALGGVYAWLGHFEEAERWIRRARFEVEDSPSAGYCDLIGLEIFKGDLSAARAHLEALRALERLGEFSLLCLANSELWLGNMDGAREALARGARTSGHDGVPRLILAAVALHDGDRAHAERLLEEESDRLLELRNLCDGRCLNVALARTRALQGRSDEAVALVERGLGSGWDTINPTGVDPFLASIESDPRFRAAVDAFWARIERERERLPVAR